MTSCGDMLSAIKLLYLNPAGALGGAERVLLDSARIVQARRPDWRLELIASSQGGLVEEAQACGIANSVLRFPSMIAGLSETRKTMAELGRVGLALPAILEYSRALSAELVRRAPNLIHANGLKMQVLGAHALPEQCKLIWHLHDYVRSRPLMKRLLRRYAPRCNAIIAVSHSVAADIAQVLHGVTPIYTVHNGVALDEFSPDGMCVDLDGLSGLSPPGSEVVRVGLVATGAWWKGHEVFLRALASLPQNAPVRGYVIGGPIYETEASQFSLAELRAMAMRYGVTARTGFTGYLAKVAPALRALDLVIHASVAPEPFGLVLAEAMACGRPVISSALGGAAELVENGRNAVTYRSDDPEELSAVILRLASNRELRARLGAEARASAVQRFDRERMGAQIVSIYEAALMAPARGGDAHPARA